MFSDNFPGNSNTNDNNFENINLEQYEDIIKFLIKSETNFLDFEKCAKLLDKNSNANDNIISNFKNKFIETFNQNNNGNTNIEHLYNILIATNNQNITNIKTIMNAIIKKCEKYFNLKTIKTFLCATPNRNDYDFNHTTLGNRCKKFLQIVENISKSSVLVSGPFRKFFGKFGDFIYNYMNDISPVEFQDVIKQVNQLCNTGCNFINNNVNSNDDVTGGPVLHLKPMNTTVIPASTASSASLETEYTNTNTSPIYQNMSELSNNNIKQIQRNRLIEFLLSQNNNNSNNKNKKNKLTVFREIVDKNGDYNVLLSKFNSTFPNQESLINNFTREELLEIIKEYDKTLQNKKHEQTKIEEDEYINNCENLKKK